MAVLAPPAGVPPDVAAAWAAMCDPVRARMAHEAPPNRARQVALGLLRREASRRQGGQLGAPAAPLRPDARILAIRLDNFGDALITSPAYRRIKAALPTCEITVLAGPWADDVARHCPMVSRVRVCRYPAFDQSARAGGGLRRLRRAALPYTMLLDQAAALREERFDAAINFRPDFWWGAALAALAGIPRRLGFGTLEAAPFLNVSLPAVERPVGRVALAQPGSHAATSSLALADRLLHLAGRQAAPAADGEATEMVYEPTAAERADAVRLWRARDLDEAPAVVAIHAEPGAPAKRWLVDGFTAVANHLAGHHRATVVLTGGPADVESAQQIAAACSYKPVVLAGHTSYGVLAALLERCRFAVGTDNGVMHLASARGVPQLRLFGPTDASVWGPWPADGPHAPPANVLSSPRACAPCHRLDLPAWPGGAYPCMADIRADAAIAEVERVWAATADRASGRA